MKPQPYMLEPWRAQQPYARPRVIQNALPSVEKVPLSIRWSLYLFVFTLPFEQVVLPILSGNLSLARIAALFVIMSCLLHKRLSISRSHPAFLFFALYLVIHYGREAIASRSLTGSFLGSYLMLVQLFLFALLISGPLRDQKLAVRTLAIFVGAGALLGVAMLAQVPGFTTVVATHDVVRIQATAADPNFLGTTLALAFVMSVGILLGKEAWISSRGRVLLGILTPFLPIAILMMASRTALVALSVGTLLYLLPVFHTQSTTRKLVMVSSCLVIVATLVARDPVIMTRLANAINEGDLSGRQRIAVAGIAMFDERPIWGWGPASYRPVLGADPHNLFLHLLLGVGIAGTLPFVLGLLLCFGNAWRERGSMFGRICLASFVTLMVGNLALNWIAFKPFWLVLAATLAARGTTKSPHANRLTQNSYPTSVPLV